MGAYIKENWLFVVVAVYLVSMVLYGHYRGFVRLAVSAVSLVLSLGVVHFGAPSVANLLRSNEVVYQAVEDSVTKFIQKDDEAENEAADAAPPSVQRSIIEEMELPEQLKDALLENNKQRSLRGAGCKQLYPLRQPLSGKQPDQYYKLFSAVCSRVRRTACSVRIAQCGLPAADHIGAEPSGRCRVGGRGRDLFSSGLQHCLLHCSRQRRLVNFS